MPNNRSTKPPGRCGRLARAGLGALMSAALAVTGVGAFSMPASAVTDEDPKFRLTKGDLEFILKQIKVSEAHAEAVRTGDEDYSLVCQDPADTSWTCVPDPKLPYGLGTIGMLVDGCG